MRALLHSLLKPVSYAFIVQDYNAAQWFQIVGRLKASHMNKGS
jgi:hypothetical protein